MTYFEKEPNENSQSPQGAEYPLTAQGVFKVCDTRHLEISNPIIASDGVSQTNEETKLEVVEEVQEPLKAKAEPSAANHLVKSEEKNIKKHIKYLTIITIIQIIVILLLAYKVYNPASNTAIPNLPAQNIPTQPDISDLAGNGAIRGSSDAPVTIIEFSDYQCPFCQKFYLETLPQLDQKYIQTGKVKLVYRNFPLSFHQYAEKAAEAAECAGEQGKFWEMHDKIFDNGADKGITAYKQWAQGLGLDTAKFNQCLDSGKMQSKIQKDIADGTAAGVTGTPAFLINGQSVVGAQPFSVFDQIIQQKLSG